MGRTSSTSSLESSDTQGEMPLKIAEENFEVLLMDKPL